MKTLLIVYHSITGSTEQMARAAARAAAREPEVAVRLSPAPATEPEALLEAVGRPKQIAASDLARCEEVGATLAAGLSLGIF